MLVGTKASVTGQPHAWAHLVGEQTCLVIDDCQTHNFFFSVGWLTFDTGELLKELQNLNVERRKDWRNETDLQDVLNYL